jgi:type IV secretion system protein VirB9
MKRLAYLATTFLITASSLAYADGPGDPELPADNRIKILTYAETDVYTIPTKYGYQTNIVFDPKEAIETVSVGDRSLWQIIPNNNRIFLRPLTDGLATNMTVITNKHEYHFDIKSVGSEKTNNIYVAEFRYPDDRPPLPPVTLMPMDEPTAPPTPVAAPVKPVVLKPAPQASVQGNGVAIPPLDTQRSQNPNYNYTYTGEDAIAPARVYDDGRSTYIEYASKPDIMPIPYLVADNGESVMATHKVDGNVLVIPNVASGWLLKGPSGTIHVYNEMLTAQ